MRTGGLKLESEMEGVREPSPEVIKGSSGVPPPPPLPPQPRNHQRELCHSPQQGLSYVSAATKDFWERLFHESYRADVVIHTDNGGIVYAHANVIGMASPVLRGMLKQAKRHGRWRSISIRGVPEAAVHTLVRFLYSSCYEKQDMERFVMHLLVLSHAYAIPQLKRLCEWHLEHGLLTTENVVDVFQLALLCDVPRLTLISHRMILRNFSEVSASQGWKVMKRSHPTLEKELLESVADEENRQKERIRKLNERKIYGQLYEAMEALIHICRDGCKTIGPHDKDFQADQMPCKYGACKSLELLIRHFAGCKLRVPGGCIHCRRMWQLLELHSRLCADPNECRVPLCRNFKEKSKKQSKKEEMRWRLLVKHVLETKRLGGGSPFFLPAPAVSS